MVPVGDANGSGEEGRSASAWARSRAWARARSRSIKAARDAGRRRSCRCSTSASASTTQGQPQGARGAGQVGRLRRRRRSRTASRARSCSAAIDLRQSSAAAEAQRERESGQTTLFGAVRRRRRRQGSGRRRRRSEDKYPDVDEWMPKELLAFEKEALGFYISGHPLDRYAGEIRRFTNATAANCIEKGERAEVILAGVVARLPGAPDEERRTASTPSSRWRTSTARSSSSSTRRRSRSTATSCRKDEPLLVTGTVDAPFGEGETARERLRFLDAKLLARDPRREELAARHQAQRRRRQRGAAARAGEAAARAHRRLPRRAADGDPQAQRDRPGPRATTTRSPPRDDLLARIEQIFGDRVAVFASASGRGHPSRDPPRREPGPDLLGE